MSILGHHMMINNDSPRIIQYKVTGQNSATSVTLTFDSAISDGDLIYFFVTVQTTSAVSGPAGFTQIGSVGATSPCGTLWYKIASGESGGYTFTCGTSSNMGVAGITFDFANEATPYEDVVTSTSGASNVTGLATAAIDVNASSILLAALSHQSADFSVSWSNSFIELVHERGISLAYRKYPLADTAETTTGTLGNNRKRSIAFQVNAR